MKESIDNTELTTILLVTIILLIVYRSPGLVLVPLVSIGVSFFASLNLIALVAQWADRHQELLGTIGRWMGRQQFDFQVFTTTHIFIVVVLFGAATDYCLFLIARYREELERGLEPQAALGRGPGANGARPDGQRHDDDPGAGGDDLCGLRQVPFRRPHDCHLAGRGPAGLHDRGPGHAAGLWPRGLLAFRRRRQGAGQDRRGIRHLPRPLRRGLMGRFWNRLADVIVAHPGLILAGVSSCWRFRPGMDSTCRSPTTCSPSSTPSARACKARGCWRRIFSSARRVPSRSSPSGGGGNFDTPEQWAKISRR